MKSYFRLAPTGIACGPGMGKPEVWLLGMVSRMRSGPGTLSGYRITDYRNINPESSSLEDFKTFVEEAHKRNVRIMSNFVMDQNRNENPVITFGDSDQSGFPSKNV